MSSETTHGTDGPEAVVGTPAGADDMSQAGYLSDRGSNVPVSESEYDSCDDLEDRDEAYYNNNASDGYADDRGEAYASSGDDLGMHSLSVTGRSDSDLMPPPGMVPDTYVCQIDRLTGRITTREGREICVDPTLLGDEFTAPTPLDSETRNAILEQLSELDRSWLPGEWLTDYLELAKGLGTSRSFREAVERSSLPMRQPEEVVYPMSAEAAGGTDYVTAAAEVLHAMGSSDTSDGSQLGPVTQDLGENQSNPVGDASNASGIKGLAATEPATVKLELGMDDVVVLQDIAAPAGAEGGVVDVPMDVEASPPIREAVTAVTLIEPTEKPVWVALTTEQLNTEAMRIANEKKTKGQQELLELKEETRKLEAQRKELDERRRQLRKEDRADKERLAALEKERQEQEAKVAADGFVAPAKERKKAAKAAKLAAAAKAKAAESISESDSDASDASDAPKAGLDDLATATPKLREVWDNARKKFSQRRPTCFSDCAIAQGQFGCPP